MRTTSSWFCAVQISATPTTTSSSASTNYSACGTFHRPPFSNFWGTVPPEAAKVGVLQSNCESFRGHRASPQPFLWLGLPQAPAGAKTTWLAPSGAKPIGGPWRSCSSAYVAPGDIRCDDGQNITCLPNTHVMHRVPCCQAQHIVVGICRCTDTHTDTQTTNVCPFHSGPKKAAVPNNPNSSGSTPTPYLHKAMLDKEGGGGSPPWASEQ